MTEGGKDGAGERRGRREIGKGGREGGRGVRREEARKQGRRTAFAIAVPLMACSTVRKSCHPVPVENRVDLCFPLATGKRSLLLVR